MTLSSSNYPFGGAVTTIIWPHGFFRISTAKEGVFSKQPTMISAIQYPAAPVSENTVLCKIMWVDALRKNDRRNCHHSLVKRFNEVFNLLGESDPSIKEFVTHPDVVAAMFEDVITPFRNRGMVREFINILKK